MSVKAAEVIKAMMKMGAIVTINQVIDQDTAYSGRRNGPSSCAIKRNALEDALDSGS